MTNDYSVRIPKPTPIQQRIIDCTAKRIVVCTGRRVGKTTLGAMIAVVALTLRKRVLIASTSQDQADIFWRYLRHWAAPLFDSGLAYKNESRRIMEFEGGLLRVKTGSEADVLRGFSADVLILDECAYLDPTAWYEVGVPMMADTNGTAYFLSTPVRKNWFYALYNRAITDTTGRWAAFHATTHGNPHLHPEAVAELASDMTEDSYRQEILAEFLEGDGQVFRNVAECATVQPTEPYEGHFVMGVDTAQQSDYTVCAIIDSKTRRQVAMDRFNRVGWQVYRDRVRAMAERWNVASIVFETNSIGSPNFEALQQDGLPVIGFETTATTKPPLIESLALAFERKEIAILDDPVLLSELGAYERQVSQRTGRSQYNAPAGMHDDTVMALALAWHGVTDGAQWLMA